MRSQKRVSGNSPEEARQPDTRQKDTLGGRVSPHKLGTLKVGNFEVADTPCFADTPVRFTALARVVPKVDSAIR